MNATEINAELLIQLQNLVGLAESRGKLHEYVAALNDARAAIEKALASPQVDGKGSRIHGILLNSNTPDSEDREMIYILERALPEGHYTFETFLYYCQEYVNSLMEAEYKTSNSPHIEHAVFNIDELFKVLRFQGFEVEVIPPGELFDFDSYVESMEDQ